MGADRKLALVTGAAGLVGDRVSKRLLREGLSVRTLDQRPVDVAEVQPYLGDVTDPGVVQRATAGAALVVHCAAVIMGTSEQMMRVNVEGTRVLVEAALQAGCERFLYMSTMAVYAFEDRPVVDESTPFLHDGPPFQLSRVRAEEAVWTASTRGLPVTVLRPPNILGAHPTSVWSVLLVQRMINGNFVFSGDGSASFPYAHVDNLVDAVLAAANTPRAAGEAYNIVDGQTTGLAYTDRFRHWLRLEPFPTRPEITPWRGRYSGAKAERELGYVPGVSYEEAMSETERYLIQCGMIKR